MKFDESCCRCRMLTHPSTELGGIYGGVICVNHRSCLKCWFNAESQYGQRKKEPKLYRKIPLVNCPRRKLKKRNGDNAIECFGCYYKVPYHVSVQTIIESQQDSEEEYKLFGYILVE